MKKRTILGFTVSGFFLWLALKEVDFSKVPALISQISPVFILFALLSLTAEHLVRAVRWKAILHGRELPFGQVYSALILGFFFNNVFPVRAGEAIRAVYLGRKKLVPASEAFGSVVVERLLDGIVVAGFVTWILTAYPVRPLIQKAGLSAIAFFFGVLAVLLVLQLKRDWLDKALNIALKPFPESGHKKIRLVAGSFIEGISTVASPARFAKAILLSLAAWFFSLVTFVILLQAFGLPLGFGAAVTILGVIAIGSMIPSSPGMIGVFEYCCIIALVEILGQSNETAIAFGLLAHGLSYFYIIIVGAAILVRENLSVRELQQSTETQPIESSGSTI